MPDDILQRIGQIEQQVSDLQRYNPSNRQYQFDMHAAPNMKFYAPVRDFDARDKSDYLFGNVSPGTAPTFDVGQDGRPGSSLRFNPVDGVGADPWLYWTEHTSQRVQSNLTVAVKVFPVETPFFEFSFLFGKGSFTSWNLIQEPGYEGKQVSFSVFLGDELERQHLWGYSDCTLRMNEWNSIIATRRNDGLMRLYVNGFFTSGMFEPGDFHVNADPIIAGASYGERGFNGMMSRFYLLDRCFTHQEALAFHST